MNTSQAHQVPVAPGIPEVSIIVPVYRAAKTIDRCVRSVVRQRFGDWELILVDDCSPAPDRSAEKMAAWAARDGRVRVVTHDRNRGVSQARFTGLAAARGRYVMFVDSDDWIPPRAVASLHRRIESEGADIAIGAMVKVLDRFGIIRGRARNTVSGPNRTQTIRQPELFDRFFINYFGVGLLPVSMCGRIYRREAIDCAQLSPSPTDLGEDLMFNLELHPYLTSIAFVTDTVYFYRLGGITMRSTPRFLSNARLHYTARMGHIRRWGYDKAVASLKTEFVNCFHSHFRNRIMLDGASRGEVEAEIRRELRDPFYASEQFDGLAAGLPAIMRTVETEVRRLTPRHHLAKAISKLLV